MLGKHLLFPVSALFLLFSSFFFGEEMDTVVSILKAVRIGDSFEIVKGKRPAILSDGKDGPDVYMENTGEGFKRVSYRFKDGKLQEYHLVIMRWDLDSTVYIMKNAEKYINAVTKELGEPASSGFIGGVPIPVAKFTWNDKQQRTECYFSAPLELYKSIFRPTLELANMVIGVSKVTEKERDIVSRPFDKKFFVSDVEKFLKNINIAEIKDSASLFPPFIKDAYIGAGIAELKKNGKNLQQLGFGSKYLTEEITSGTDNFVGFINYYFRNDKVSLVDAGPAFDQNGLEQAYKWVSDNWGIPDGIYTGQKDERVFTWKKKNAKTVFFTAPDPAGKVNYGLLIMDNSIDIPEYFKEYPRRFLLEPSTGLPEIWKNILNDLEPKPKKKEVSVPFRK